ncbi:MAG TPA: ATP-dependent 6-phosphofructokinase [Acidimicrobiales bacterium]|nr:ATP-dependent 6-phosphofructokinase [Acidimicrobiales bacterium]
MRIGILTGGGDCPGLNAAIRAVVLSAELSHGDEVVGYLDGWRGVLEDEYLPLDVHRCRDILALGGTVLGTSRTNPFKVQDGPERVVANLAAHNVDALVAVGGEDTLGVAHRLGDYGVCAVGVPKTIDNDLSGTEMTFGFDTAVQTATEAIDRLRTTAESHHRVIVCEVMGRHVGWIATYAGMAGGAAEILVPEVPFDVEEVCLRLKRRHRGGQFSSIVVIAEGAVPVEGPDADSARLATSGAPVDQFGHARLGGIGAWLAEELERRTGFEARVTILGHIQRGGSPSAFDRVLATRFGVAAVTALHDGAFGMMVALQAGEIVRVPIAEAVARSKTVELDLYSSVAGVFLG